MCYLCNKTFFIHMKRIAGLLILMFTLSIASFAKKDSNAWKAEKTMDAQFQVFKDNVNFWNGSYFMKPEQLNEFYKALTDTISGLQKDVNNRQVKIQELQDEIRSQNEQIRETQSKLDESIKYQNSIKVLGININKNVYSISMYLFIAGVLVLAGIVFMLYKRSHTVTARTKKDYEELKEEYEAHKKSALDRYTKINMELHKTRLELKKK